MVRRQQAAKKWADECLSFRANMYSLLATGFLLSNVNFVRAWPVAARFVPLACPCPIGITDVSRLFGTHSDTKIDDWPCETVLIVDPTLDGLVSVTPETAFYSRRDQKKQLNLLNKLLTGAWASCKES